MQLNENAAALVERIVSDAQRLRVAVHSQPSGGRVIDMGIGVRGGLEAGLALAEVCMAGLGRVSLARAPADLWDVASVVVWTDHPTAACMASQYAGWRIASEGFFAMGSGPMRAAAGKEELFERIGHRERPRCAVGVLETRTLPPTDVTNDLARQMGIDPPGLTLLVAPTASQAGGVQIVARSIETALHKLHELSFDLSRVESAFGTAPLPPVAADDLAAIGRTNDAILYGGEVSLWVRGDDESLQAIGPRVPSNASADFGEPFAIVFARHGHDFYKIDPLLFSPAVVTLSNLDSGRTYRFGQTRPDVIRRSFAE
jgi:methenyltetrahydromethanopterin cyclohydrolase